MFIGGEKKQNLIFKAIAVSIIGVMLVQDIGFANPNPGFFQKAVFQTFQQNGAEASFQGKKIEIHPGAGKIIRSYEGKKPAAVFLIQDAHFHREAQENAAAAMTQLMDQFNIQTVGIEGAAGELWHDWATRYPDEKVRTSVFKFLLAKHQIGAAEFALSQVKTKSPMRLFGLEQEPLYRRHLQVDRLIRSQRPGMQTRLNEWQNLLRAIQSQVMPSEYNSYKASVSSLNEQGIAGIKALVQIANEKHFDLSGYPQITAYLEIEKHIEAIDSTLLMREYRQVKEIDLRVGLLKLALKSNHAQIEWLRHQFINRGVTEKYPHLTEWLRVMELSCRLNEGLLKEIKNLDSAIRVSFLETDEQAWIDQLSEWTDLLNAWEKLEWTPEDAAHYERDHAEFLSESALAKIIEIAKQHSVEMHSLAWKELFQSKTWAPWFEFYFTALERDAVLAKNTEKLLQISGSKPVLIYAGGFHTPGLERALKSRSISYVTIRPVIGREQEASERVAYEKALDGDIGFFEKILRQSMAAARRSERVPFELQTARLFAPLDAQPRGDQAAFMLGTTGLLAATMSVTGQTAVNTGVASETSVWWDAVSVDGLTVQGGTAHGTVGTSLGSVSLRMRKSPGSGYEKMGDWAVKIERSEIRSPLLVAPPSDVAPSEVQSQYFGKLLPEELLPVAEKIRSVRSEARILKRAGVKNNNVVRNAILGKPVIQKAPAPAFSFFRSAKVKIVYIRRKALFLLLAFAGFMALSSSAVAGVKQVDQHSLERTARQELGNAGIPAFLGQKEKAMKQVLAGKKTIEVKRVNFLKLLTWPPSAIEKVSVKVNKETRAAVYKYQSAKVGAKLAQFEPGETTIAKKPLIKKAAAKKTASAKPAAPSQKTGGPEKMGGHVGTESGRGEAPQPGVNKTAPVGVTPPANLSTNASEDAKAAQLAAQEAAAREQAEAQMEAEETARRAQIRQAQANQKLEESRRREFLKERDRQLAAQKSIRDAAIEAAQLAAKDRAAAASKQNPPPASPDLTDPLAFGLQLNGSPWAPVSAKPEPVASKDSAKPGVANPQPGTQSAPLEKTWAMGASMPYFPPAFAPLVAKTNSNVAAPETNFFGSTGNWQWPTYFPVVPTTTAEKPVADFPKAAESKAEAPNEKISDWKASVASFFEEIPGKAKDFFSEWYDAGLKQYIDWIYGPLARGIDFIDAQIDQIEILNDYPQGKQWLLFWPVAAWFGVAFILGGFYSLIFKRKPIASPIDKKHVKFLAQFPPVEKLEAMTAVEVHKLSEKLKNYLDRNGTDERLQDTLMHGQTVLLYSIDLEVAAATKMAQEPHVKTSNIAAMIEVAALSGMIATSFFMPVNWVLFGAIVMGARLGWTAAVLIAEWGHVAASPFALSASFRWKNLTGWHQPATWFISLLPFSPIVLSAGTLFDAVESAWQSRVIRWVGWFFGSAAVLVGLHFLIPEAATWRWFSPLDLGKDVAAFFASWSQPTYQWLSLQALALAALLAIAVNFLSDTIFHPENLKIAYCGNVAFARRILDKMTSGAMANEDAELLQQMLTITMQRGGQAAGLNAIVQDKAGDWRSLLIRRVSGRRDFIPEILVRISKRALRKFQPKNFVFFQSHVRFATGSGSSKKETHPHQGAKSNVTQWYQTPQGWRSRVAEYVNTITHNGDYDNAVKPNGKKPDPKKFGVAENKYTFREMRIIIQYLTGIKNTTEGDSPAIAMTMDLLHTKGIWSKSFLYAYMHVLPGFKEIFKDGNIPKKANYVGNKPNMKDYVGLTADDRQAMAEAWEKIWQQLISETAMPSPTAIEKAFGQFLARNTETPWGLKISPDSRADFARHATNAFLNQDTYAALKEFMEHADGSFGLVVTSPLEPNRTAAASRYQPLSLGFDFNPETGEAQFAVVSEAAALKARTASGKGFSERIDLDQFGGELVQIGIPLGKKT